MTPGLAKWRDAAPGRAVVTKRAGGEYLCTCTEHDAVIVVGRGTDADGAEFDAASQLWRLALEAAAPPSDPPARFVERPEPRIAPKKRR